MMFFSCGWALTSGVSDATGVWSAAGLVFSGAVVGSSLIVGVTVSALAEPPSAGVAEDVEAAAAGAAWPGTRGVSGEVAEARVEGADSVKVAILSDVLCSDKSDGEDGVVVERDRGGPV